MVNLKVDNNNLSEISLIDGYYLISDNDMITVLTIDCMNDDFKIANLKNLRKLICTADNLILDNLPSLKILSLDLISLRVISPINIDELSLQNLMAYDFIDFKKIQGNYNFRFWWYDDQFVKINLYKHCYTKYKSYQMFENYKARLEVARKILIKLLLKNRIKYFFNRFLEARKDGISRYCFLANDL